MSTSASHQEAGRLGLLASVTIVGLACFAATALLLPIVSEYSLTADYISELAIGRYGYLQTAAFFAAGLGTLSLAVGVREATRGSWGSGLGSALVGLYGVGLILAGIFPTDKIDPAGRVVLPTSAGTVHLVASALAFVLVIAGMFVLSRTFKRDARWQAVWPWSLVLALATLIGVIVAAPSEGPCVGLIQRSYIGTIILWQVFVAFWLRSIAESASAEQSPRVR